MTYIEKSKYIITFVFIYFSANFVVALWPLYGYITCKVTKKYENDSLFYTIYSLCGDNVANFFAGDTPRCASGRGFGGGCFVG